ncbi:SRPBCC domain-containing protein [Compostibacter hankyongensis]|uniref:SRPBCC domain-containing protein n=1 Tax=Compostibacter hankyongensis TaxID=1007089 RepID=A0ABP8G999_9BACT
MADIRHNVVIKAAPEKIYEALTTQEGLSGWWAKQTVARPEEGFVNVFTFGDFRNEMKVTVLDPGKRVEWLCIRSIDEWMGTNISFELEERNERTLLRFAHSGWRAITDTFAGCNYDWGRFMTSLKSYCETGKGTPS